MTDQSIWEYPLKVTGVQAIDMPAGAVPLTVQVQNGVPCLWALVTYGASIERKIIETFGTGQPFEAGNRRYISTYQVGPLVFHVFESLEHGHD